MKIAVFPKIIIFLYCALFLVFVRKFAINLPFQDDVNLLQTTLFENDFKSLIINLFSADSDHIQVYPKLTALFQYEVFGHVNFHWLALWMNLLVIISLIFLIGIPKKIKNFYYLIPAFPFILQPQLHEIIFWVLPGLQHAYAMLFMILAVYFLDIQKKYNTVSLFMAASATFCTGNGLLAFIAIIYVLILYRRPLWSTLIVFIVCLAAFLYNYKPSPAVKGTVDLSSIIHFNSLFWASPFEIFNRLHLHQIAGFILIILIIALVIYLSIQIFTTRLIASMPIARLLAILFFCGGTALLISLSREYEVIFSRFQFYSFVGFVVLYLILLESTSAFLQKRISILLGGLFILISLFSYYSNFVKIENTANKYLADTYNWQQDKTMLLVDQPFLNLAEDIYSKVDNKNIKIGDDLISEKNIIHLITHQLKKWPKSIPQLNLVRDTYPRRYFASDHYLLTSETFEEKKSIDDAWFLVFSNKNKQYIVAPQYNAVFKATFLKTKEYYQKGFYADIPALNFAPGLYNIYFLHKDKNIGFEIFDCQQQISFEKPAPVLIYK
ncbi:MAG: hypothetical protein V4683_08660 [Bacteroidota bacterium]